MRKLILLAVLIFLICCLLIYYTNIYNVQCVCYSFCNYAYYVLIEDDYEVHKNFIEAVKTGDMIKVKLYILRYPSFIDKQDGNNCTPLFYAVDTGNTELVSFFIDKGADVNKLIYIKGSMFFSDGDYITGTVLLRAILNKNITMTRLLLSRGADPNKRDTGIINDLGCKSLAYTPLHCAVRADSIQIAKILIENGANPYCKNYEGQTPLDMAIEGQQRDMIEFLAKYDRKKVK